MRKLILPLVAALVVSWAAVPAFAAATSYFWVGSAGGSGGDNHSWGDVNNWNPKGTPGDDPGDSATIAPPDASHCTVHIDMTAVTLANFSMTAGSDPGCGSASINGGSLTVTGSFSWNGGSLTTPTTLAAGSTGTISGSVSKLNTLWRDLDVSGSLTLSGVTGTGASNTGALMITTDAGIGRILHIHSGGSLIADGPADVRHLSCCTAPGKIVNDGTISVSSGDLVDDGVELDQNGTISASSGGRIVSDGSPITASNGASYTGSGSWLIEDGSKAVLSGTQTVGSGFHLELGGLNVNAGAQLGGTATLTGAGSLDWTGGTIEGNLTIAHGMTVHASGAHSDNGKRVLAGQDALSGFTASVLTNHGTITFDTGAGVLTSATAQLVNASDGKLSLAPGTVFNTVSCCVSPSKVINHGTLTVPTGASTDPAVLEGVAYQTDATTSIATGRQLTLDTAPGSLTSATVGSGGTLAVAAPLAVSSTTTIGTGTSLLLENGGALNGTATLAGAGKLHWTGGSVSGNVTVTATGGTSVTGADQKYLSNIGGGSTPSKLTLKSTASMVAGTSAQHNVLNLGQSTLTLASSTTLANFDEIYAGTLVNSGSLSVDPGSGGTVNRSGSGPLNNHGTLTVRTGTLTVGGAYNQYSGVTNVAKGAYLALAFVSRSIAMSGGVLEGSGTINAGVTQTGGTVRPAGSGTGTLHIAGGYAEGAHGTLAIDLASTVRDRLAVGGAVSLKGHLTARNLGTYAPHTGVKYTVLTAQSLVYAVTCMITSGHNAATGHWAVGHTSTAVALTWRSGADTHC
jgi:hypothetical protein